MKRKEKISPQEVQKAINKFLKKGGLIVKLPDQNIQSQRTIGEDKYEIYESIGNFPTLN